MTSQAGFVRTRNGTRNTLAHKRMIQVLLIFTGACILIVVAARAFPGARWLSATAALATFAIIYAVSATAWWCGLYFQLVPVYQALAALKVYRTEGALGALIFFGPPIVPTALVLLAFRRLRGRRSLPTVS